MPNRFKIAAITFGVLLLLALLLYLSMRAPIFNLVNIIQ